MRCIGLLVALTSGAILVACATPTTAPEPDLAETQVPESSLTLDTLQNMTYTLPDGREITLRDGMFEERPSPDSATFIANFSLKWDLSAFGDLTGDGADDAAVILIDAPGGSGSFVYLAAVIEEASLPVNTDTVMLGDRVQIESNVIEDMASLLTVVTHGPDDPMCCPSERHIWGYSLADGDLTLESDELVGQLQ